MDNSAIARILREIADLLELKNDNPFKIRAYRNAADIAANHPHDLSRLDEAGLREIPGIGKDLAARIREIGETGDAAYHRELVAEFPSSILDLLHLQGVGPKTVSMLYRELDIRTLHDLEAAAKSGRIRALRGMGARKEALILKALEDRKRFAGRLLLPAAHDAAAGLVAFLSERVPHAVIDVVGSLRRGCDTCGDLDLLVSSGQFSEGPASAEQVSSARQTLLDELVEYPLIERVLGHGDTKSSILIAGGVQADVRVVSPESRGAAMQYFTGSKAHNIALRDRAIGHGFKLNEYGLFRLADDVKVAGEREEDIYRALGLDWIPPELREMRGELGAAEAHLLPRLIARTDLRGDLHTHTNETDGKDDIRTMAQAAQAAGLEYLAITDHSQSTAMANGMDERRVLAHARRIRSIDAEHLGIRLLAGVECDIRPDGSLDLNDECLAALDVVVASVHSAFGQDRQRMTERLLRAVENPHVDILGHPTGRLLLSREAYALDVDAVVRAASSYGVALEINSQIDRLDLSDAHAKLAVDRGAKLVISSDAHSRNGIAALQWGVRVARRAWARADDVLNSQPLERFHASLRRNRERVPNGVAGARSLRAGVESGVHSGAKA